MAELNLNVNVDTKNANKLDSIGKKLGGLGKQAAVGLGIAAGAGIAVGAVLVDMAAEAEQTQAKLNSVFESTGAAAFTSIEALDAHATALAAATTFDDDSVKEAQATLLSFGNITGEAFTDATEASADLAAFMGTDMPQASKALGKALAIPEAAAGKLAKMGIILTDAQQAQIDKFVEAGDTAAAQGVILDAVSGKFGTVAEDLAATSGGQMTQAMNALGEAGESLGTILLPLLTGLAGGVKFLADIVVANMPLIQSVISTVIGFISGLFSNAGGAVGGLSQAFGMVVAFWQANGPVIMSVAQQVFGAIINVLKVVIPILLEVAKVIFPILATAAGVMFNALDIAFKGIGGAFEVLGNVFETVSGVITGLVGGVVGAFKEIYNGFARFWNSIQISVPSIDIPFVGKVGGFSFGLPDIPLLASGGIVTKPTLAIIGENGPEAVIPLGRDRMAGTTNYFTYHVQSPIPDEKALVELVTRSQRLTDQLAWD